MQYSSAGLALTKRFEESLRLTAYQDGAGVWTIGYGSTLPVVHSGETITEPEAETRLLTDMSRRSPASMSSSRCRSRRGSSMQPSSARLASNIPHGECGG